MLSKNVYVFPPEKRAALEALRHPVAAYQFVDDKLVTLLVSDGMCAMAAMEREALVQLFNTDMYRGTHPDDVARIAELAHRFMIDENEYDVTYRSILYGRMEYRYLHATSKFHIMEDGSRVAFTVYDDVTDLMKKRGEHIAAFNEPKIRFLDENLGAMAVVARRDRRLLYYNKALLRMLPPKVKYDSGRTFEDFFYNGEPQGIAGLFDHIDMGPVTVTEPLTGRSLEVSALSSIWGDVPATTLFFYEHSAPAGGGGAEIELRRRRIAFNAGINTGTANGRAYYEPGYKAFWVWNLSQGGAMVREEGHAHVHMRLGRTFTYPDYWRFIQHISDGDGDADAVRRTSLENLLALQAQGIASLEWDFTVHTDKGQVNMHTEFVMMESPDDGDIYMKVTEENVTDAVLLKVMLTTLVRDHFDFAAFIDARADRCGVVSGKTDNPSQQEFAGRLSDLYVTLSDRMGVACRTSGDLLAFIESACGDGEEASYIHRLPDGSRRDIQMRIIDRKNRQYAVGSIDVTRLLEREEAQQDQLREALLAAQAANDAKSDFVSRISHDIRTPLSIISSMTDFAIEDLGDPDRLRDDLGKIRTANTFLLSLISDVLDIAKIDSGKITLSPETWDLADFAAGIRDMFGPLCAEKGLAFTLAEDGDYAGAVMADRTRLNQIALNLVSNAVKYTLPGGSVAVTLKAASLDGGQVALAIEVRDTGIGMSPEFQKAMFKPFTQEADNPLRPPSAVGTGLGLSIVQRMVDLMGGTLSVESAPGRGTAIRCSVACPAAGEGAGGAAPAPAKVSRPPLSGRILIAEDNVINAAIARRIAGSFGLETEVAANGAEALSAFEAAPAGTYRAVLMDIQMPVMSGLEATRAIRALPREDARTVPIIAMTADAFAGAMEKGLATGMDAYLVKPIDPDALYAAIAGRVL